VETFSFEEVVRTSARFKWNSMQPWACWIPWWGRWGALVRRHRPGDEPRHPTDGNMTDVVFTGVAQRWHTSDDDARHDGGGIGAHADNVLSAFDRVPHRFVGVEVTDARAVRALVNAANTNPGPGDSIATCKLFVRSFSYSKRTVLTQSECFLVTQMQHPAHKRCSVQR